MAKAQSKIRDKILKKYNIDIDSENIIKLYKIEISDSESDIKNKILETENKWKKNLNSPNDRVRIQSENRLKNAGVYSEILTDSKIIKELFEYYSAYGNEEIQFARSYFRLVSTTKRITGDDVKFFFKYYKDQRKSKQAIETMLKNEYNVIFKSKDDEKDDDSVRENKKKEGSKVIVNLFSEATVIKVKSIVEKFDEASCDDSLKRNYPKLEDSLYQLIEIEDYESIDEYKKFVDKEAARAYEYRQDKKEYTPIVDIYNTLKDLCEYADVVDNFLEFKLLLKYPTLTPYMYAFSEMKKSTMNGMVDIAQREYEFRDEPDFVLNYYEPVSDNFGISNNGIGSILKNAKKKAKRNELLRNIDEKLGRTGPRLGLLASIIHYLVYLPIYVVYIIFEIIRVLFTNFDRKIVWWSFFIILTVIFNIALASRGVVYSLFEMIKNLPGGPRAIMQGLDPNGDISKASNIIIIITLGAVLPVISLLDVGVPLFVTTFLGELSTSSRKDIDWIGKKRTFQEIFKHARKNSIELSRERKGYFIGKGVLKIVLNTIICTIIIILCLKLPRSVGNGFNNSMSWLYSNGNGEDTRIENIEETKNSYTSYVVVQDEGANLRAGAGKDFDVIRFVDSSEQFDLTGETEEVDGTTWYQVYLGETDYEYGWFSEKVVTVNEY